MSGQHEQVACILLGHGTRPAKDDELSCACGTVICAACAPFDLCAACLDEKVEYDYQRAMAEAEYEEEERERGRERARERLEEEHDHLKFWKRGF